MPTVPKKAKNDELVCRIFEYVREHAKDDITLRSTAEHFGYEYHYLSRILNKSYNINFSQLVNSYRVEKAIELLPKGARFLDLCTGSGCIAISTLAERKDTSAIMVDKFEKTLLLAQKNALHNGVENRVEALIMDVLKDENMLENERFDAILSNPPYIRPEVIETLSEEVKKEPYVALYGGDDGLLFYNKITRDYSELLKKDGIIIYEIGYDQANDITIIANKNNFNCQIVKDYGGNDRVAILTKK